MPPTLFAVRSYSAIVCLFLITLLITFVHRAAYFDEAWFAEQSFWLIKEGRVRSELFRGYNGWENGIYVFHKLFIHAGALVMRVTGISVATSKIVSIFFGLLGGFLVWFHGQSASREQRWLSLLLYIGCGSLIRYISVNRPETMCMTLGFVSYLALDPPGTSRPKPVLAGLFSGLSALTHLNGLIYLVAGISWLLVKMGWRSTIGFCVAGALALSLYGLDALLNGDVDMLIRQFINDPATQQNLSLGEKFTLLADYHHIFFHSQNEAALSVLVLISAILCRKRITLLQPVLLYTLLLIVSFWLLTKSNTDIYFLLFMPWLAILAASWLTMYMPTQAVWPRNIARVMLVLYCFVAVTQFVYVLRENRDSPDIEKHNALLARYMPAKHTPVIAPLEFFFGQMDNYRIRGLTYYQLLEREKGPIPLETFFQLANKSNVEYIVSDHRLDSSYDIPVNAPAEIGAYQRIFQDNRNTIYARKQKQ